MSTCIFCNETVDSNIKDDLPICHECYITLFNQNKSLDDKIEYLKHLTNKIK